MMVQPSNNGNGMSNSSSVMAVDEEIAALVPTNGPAVVSSSMSIELPSSALSGVSHTPTNAVLRLAVTTCWDEIWSSTELLFQNKLTWLLLFGPVAVYGDSTGFIGESICFVCAGLALIPCAERCVFSNYTIWMTIFFPSCPFF
jgi:hypothetical protein